MVDVMRAAVDTNDGDDPLAALLEISRAKRDLAAAEAVAVRRARIQGYSWAEIGTLLGVTKQAMHKKYGRFA